MSKRRRVCLGAFAGAHGVRGEAKLKSFTQNPEDVAAYGSVESEDGARRFTLKVIRSLKADMLLVRAPEIASREDAAALAGTRVYVDRDSLPETEDGEFYMEDLIGLTAVDETGDTAGAVAAVYNFGAGDLLELKDVPGRKGTVIIAFTKENAPVIDLAAGRITIARNAIEATLQDGQTESGETADNDPSAKSGAPRDGDS